MNDRFFDRCICMASLLSLSCLLTAQVKGDYNWQIGLKSSPGSHPYPASLELSFNNNRVAIDTFYRSAGMFGVNASYSDANGRLLAYSNGCQIRDGAHRMIPGTLSLSPGSVDYEDCLAGQNSGYILPGGGLFLSFYSDSILFLLHQWL